MKTSLLISPPATGKTQTCIVQICETLREHPLSQARVIVPDRLQALSFRRRLASSGGVLGAHVGTFSDLYKFILERAGIYIPVASNALLHRVVQVVVDETQLVHYAPLRTLPGFLLVLRDSFAELKRALIYPEDFLEKSKNAALPQQELAQLYAAYQTKLKQLNWADIEGLSWLAVAALESNPALMDNAIQLLVVDGFDSFIGTQRRALKLLADKTDVLITLEGEKDSPRSAHRRFAKTLETLRSELSPEIISLSRKPSLPRDVLHIEKNLFEAGSLQKPERTFLTEVRSPADEAREALRWIKSRVVRDEIPLHECAIFTPNPDVYQPLIRSAAREFGMPVHFTQSDPLTSSSAIAALTNLLALSAQNFKTNALFKTLRSPYFSFAIDHITIDLLEKVSRAARIVEGQAQWDETWERLISAKTESQPDLDDERALRDLPRGEDARALRIQLDGFFARLNPLDGTHTQTEWTRWLEDLLDALKFYENTSGERDELACESFREALRALVMSESIAGARVVDFQQYISDLQNALEGAAVDEPHVMGGSSLLVGNMREARGLRYQAVALLGFSEGIFPEVERPDPFLTEDLRAALGLDSRLEREQGSLFYQAVTRTDAQLLITRPYLSDDGENWEASPFWNAVKNLFKKEAVQKIRPDDARPLADAASSQELLFWAVRRKGLPKSYADVSERWRDLQHARDVVHARRAKQVEGKYEGNTPDLKDILTKRYAPEQVWSASRLEAYGSCPQMFYVSVALGLEASAPPELGLDVMQIGSILHKILEETYQTAKNPADVDSVLKNLPAVAKRVFKNAPQAYGFRPSELWDLEQGQFLSKLEFTIQELAKNSEDWTPFVYEQAFGIHDSPALKIQLDGEQILLRGVIDRVDKNADGELRVLDYKTGSSHLAQDDLKKGKRLQLPLYALAVRDALKLGKPIDGIYWAINAAKAGALKLAIFENENGEGIEAAIETVKGHLKNIVTGIRAGEFSPKPPKGGCPAYCPAAQWCWRYQKAGWS
jgi:ATP-dependent helicase/DNAse subunit B